MISGDDETVTSSVNSMKIAFDNEYPIVCVCACVCVRARTCVCVSSFTTDYSNG